LASTEIIRMKNYGKTIVFIFVVVVLTLLGWSFFSQNDRKNIIISDRMSDFIESIDQHKIAKNKMLIIFDLDDTLFMSSIMLGTPAWFYNMVNKLRISGIPSAEAYTVIGDIDRIVQEYALVVAVEPTTLNAIRRWQLEGAMVVALTSRPISFQSITDEHLEQINIDFSIPVFSCIEQEWDLSVGGFNNGVIYVGDNLSKGQAFQQFYERTLACGMKIDLVAQADDQQRYVVEIANLAKNEGLAFMGLIYGGALALREFNIDEANRQLHELEKNLGRSIIPEQYRKEFAYNN